MNTFQRWKTGTSALLRLMCAFALVAVLLKPLGLFAKAPPVYGIIAVLGYLLFLPLILVSILSMSGLKAVPIMLFCNRGGANDATVAKQKELEKERIESEA